MLQSLMAKIKSHHLSVNFEYLMVDKEQVFIILMATYTFSHNVVHNTYIFTGTRRHRRAQVELVIQHQPIYDGQKTHSIYLGMYLKPL